MLQHNFPREKQQPDSKKTWRNIPSRINRHFPLFRIQAYIQHPEGETACDLNKIPAHQQFSNSGNSNLTFPKNPKQRKEYKYLVTCPNCRLHALYFTAYIFCLCIYLILQSKSTDVQQRVRSCRQQVAYTTINTEKLIQENDEQIYTFNQNMKSQNS